MSRRALLGLLILAGTATMLAAPAHAQRPFDTLDPFYQEESARRAFYDGFAASAAVAYRAGDPLGTEVAERGPVALSVRFDYALARQVDVAAVFDVSGGLVGTLGGGPVRLSWVVVKPYWRHGYTDYAVRLAVDPATEGGFGFRQTDLAFVSTSDLSPRLSSDFAVGLRRARVGVERLELQEETVLTEGAGPEPAALDPTANIVRTRAVGTEIHAMWGHRLWLDPGGSNVSVTLLGEVMDYDLLRLRPPVVPSAGAAEEDERATEFRGGVARLRAGFEYARPRYRVAPYLSLPLVRWAAADGESRTWGPRIDHARAGVRLTLR